MTNQQDRNLEAQGAENSDKRSNSFTKENGPADNNKSNEDNGFFTDDNNRLQTKEEYEEDKGNHPGKNEKVTPLEPDTTTATLGDKITVNANNEDLVTLVKDDDTSQYENEDNQAR